MNIAIQQDSTFRMRVAITSKDGPVDIEGAQVFMQVRELNSGDLVADFSAWAKVSDTDAGVIEVDAPAAASANINHKRYDYDIALVLFDGEVYRPLRGIVIGQPKVTDYDV